MANAAPSAARRSEEMMSEPSRPWSDVMLFKIFGSPFSIDKSINAITNNLVRNMMLFGSIRSLKWHGRHITVLRGYIWHYNINTLIHSLLALTLELDFYRALILFYAIRTTSKWHKTLFLEVLLGEFLANNWYKLLTFVSIAYIVCIAARVNHVYYIVSALFIDTHCSHLVRAIVTGAMFISMSWCSLFAPAG